MQPSLCKKHFREVSNVFDKETAFAYELNEKDCVICNKIIFIEGARRFAHSHSVNASEEALRLPNSFAQLRA